MSKYELLVIRDESPIYLQASGMRILENGTLTFYDLDHSGVEEIVYAYSSTYWNCVKLVE